MVLGVHPRIPIQGLEQLEAAVEFRTVKGGGDERESDARCGEEGRATIPREAPDGTRLVAGTRSLDICKGPFGDAPRSRWLRFAVGEKSRQ